MVRLIALWRAGNPAQGMASRLQLRRQAEAPQSDSIDNIVTEKGSDG
jgi:hypothetical protein